MQNAVSKLETLVAKAPDELQVRILLVRVYQRTQRVDEALPLLEAALQRDPFNPRILYELGTIYMALDRWDEARASLEKSLEIEPAQPNVYTQLGNISLTQGDGVGFVQQFLKAIKVDPRDHELPGSLAAFLYQLGLFEEGDDFRNRVMAIAPTSPIAYRIELLRAIYSGDEEASIASARRAIEDDIDDRRFAFGGAAQHLLRTAARRGTVAEEIAYLELQAPGILDIEASSTPLKYRSVQYSAFDAWYVTLSGDEIAARIDKLLAIARSYGFDPEDDPAVRIGSLALQGRTEDAITIALEQFFTRPVSRHLGWQQDLAQAQFADFVDDPRVQAALRRWEEAEGVLRETVRVFLADVQAIT